MISTHVYYGKGKETVVVLHTLEPDYYGNDYMYASRQGIVENTSSGSLVLFMK